MRVCGRRDLPSTLGKLGHSWRRDPPAERSVLGFGCERLSAHLTQGPAAASEMPQAVRTEGGTDSWIVHGSPCSRERRPRPREQTPSKRATANRCERTLTQRAASGVQALREAAVSCLRLATTLTSASLPAAAGTSGHRAQLSPLCLCSLPGYPQNKALPSFNTNESMPR